MAFDKNKTLQSAQKFLQKGQYDKAIKEYESIVREDPKDVKIRQKLGDLYVRESRLDEALNEYNFVGKYFSDDGFYLKAIAVYKQILKIDPNQIQTNLKLAELYKKQNLIGDAIMQYQLVYTFFERKGDTVKALDILDRMAEMAPTNLSLRMRLADAYYRNGYVDRSLDEYVKIGEQLKKEGRVDDLVALYEKLVKHHPKRLDMLIELSELYIKMKKPDLADARIEMGLKVVPEDLKLLTLKSQILLTREDYNTSVKILTKILNIDSEFIEAKENLAKAYEKINDKRPLEKLYTDLMVYFRGKGEDEKADRYKVLYDNLKSTIKDEMTEPGVMGELGKLPAGDSAIIDADIIELGDENVVDAEILEEISPVHAVSDIDTKESLDEAGKSLMLKVDTYIKYGQYQEAISALKQYSKNNTELFTPRKKLVDIYLELADKGVDGGKYQKLATQELADISSLTSRKGISDYVDYDTERAHEIGASVIPSADFGKEGISEVHEFDVLSEEDISLSENIKIDEAGIDTIEIAVDEEGLYEGFEDVTHAAQGHGTQGVGSDLVDMTPKDEPLSPGDDYFDLKKELEGVVLDDDMKLESKGGAGLLGEDEHYSFEDVFQEFKRGIEKQFDKEDYETHYNLGIAYREMGLFDDAIKEFITCTNDPKRKLDSFIMLGVTFRDIGDFDKSIDYFREVLDIPTLKTDERLGIFYELAFSYESTGDLAQASAFYQRIFKENPQFRDISSKVKSLKEKMTSGGGSRKEQEPPGEQKSKDKISYV